MRKSYIVQVNDYMIPVKVNLTDAEARTVAYVLEEIAKSDEEWIKTHRD